MSYTVKITKPLCLRDPIPEASSWYPLRFVLHLVILMLLLTFRQGAIVAQVAITALSLPRLNETHWTVQAFFIASLIFGSLSVFFSCIAYQVVSALHGANEIRDWLSKPILSKQKPEFQRLLDNLERVIYHQQASALGGDEYAQLEHAIDQSIKDDRWKAVSFSSSVMLVAPARLLSLALNTFVAGLGIYLGLVYMANLMPIPGPNGSLAVLISYIFATFHGLSLFYIPLGFKKLESLPVKRFTRLMHVVRIRRERSGRIPEGGITVNVPGSKGRAEPHPEPSRHGVVGNVSFSPILRYFRRLTRVCSCHYKSRQPLHRLSSKVDRQMLQVWVNQSVGMRPHRSTQVPIICLSPRPIDFSRLLKLL